jgi:hypothetical protein
VPINEVIGALGSYYINLDQSTPRRIVDKIGYFGHIVVHSARQNHPELVGDAMLASSRYVGVVRDKQFTGATGSTAPNTQQISGSGMAYWLGDEDGKGSVIEAPGKSLDAVSFSEGVRELLPDSAAVREGTLHAVSGVWSGTYIWLSPRQALDDFCSYFSSDLGECEWRVNGDGTLDAGRIEDLYVVEPRAIITRKGAGQDLELRGVAGDAQTDEDVQDFSTRVVVLAEGEGFSTATGAANINPDLNIYVDLFGNPVELTRLVSQEGTDASNAPASAVLQLNRFLRPRSALQLSSDEYDLRGAFAPGDYVWVWDPDAGLIDRSNPPNEVYFRGERLFPIKLRLTELTWPLTKGMGVSYRTQGGEWIDLTDYIVWEDPANVDVVVGATVRTLLNSAGGEPVGGRPKGDSSIPDVMEWVLPFGLSSYQSKGGITRSQVALAWKRPINTDGTAIIDLDHYEIRWRTSAHQILPVAWQYLWQSSAQWDQLVQWDGLLPAELGPWQYTAVGPDVEQFLLGDLVPGVPYDVQIRAVDTASPPNFGFWNDSETFETFGDPFPPSEPAPPSVASSPISVQVVHTLGKSSGGTFNLESDLHHLEIHAAYEPAFTPSAASLLGKMIANIGTLLSNTPVVGTFTLASTADVWIKVVAVDDAGNHSGPSGGVQSSAELINDEFISNLTVSKVTAGEITSQWLIGSDIATAFTGVRAGMNAFGFYAFDNTNTQTFEVDALTGDVFLSGTVMAQLNNSAVLVSPSTLVGDVSPISLPAIYFYSRVHGPLPANSARVYGTPVGTDTTTMPTSLALTSSFNASNQGTAISLADNQAFFARVQAFASGPIGTPLEGYPAIGTIGAQLIISNEHDLGQFSMQATNSAQLDGGAIEVNRSAMFAVLTPLAHPEIQHGYQVQIAAGVNGGLPFLTMDGPYVFGTFSATQTLFIAAGSWGTGLGGINFPYGLTMSGTRLPICSASNGGAQVANSSTQLTVQTGVASGTGYGTSWGYA